MIQRLQRNLRLGFLLAFTVCFASSLNAFNINIDYRFDEDTTGGGLNFFDTSTVNGLLARQSLNAAASELEYWLNDSFAAIEPTASDTWKALFFDPTSSGTGTETVLDFEIPENTITVFAGAFNGGSSILLGQGSKGGYLSLSGSAGFEEIGGAHV